MVFRELNRLPRHWTIWNCHILTSRRHYHMFLISCLFLVKNKYFEGNSDDRENAESRKKSPTLLHVKLLELPTWCSGKESACQCGRHKRHGFDTWAEKIPWTRRYQPTPVFLPGKSQELRSLAGYSPLDCKESDRTERLSTLSPKNLVNLFYSFIQQT